MADTNNEKILSDVSNKSPDKFLCRIFHIIKFKKQVTNSEFGYKKYNSTNILLR